MDEVRAIADRVLIVELLARYHQAVDGKDWPGLAALFTTDAVAEYAGLDTTVDLMGLGGRIEGREAIVAWIEAGQAPFQFGGAPTHFMLNHVFQVLEPDRAVTRSSFHDLDLVTGLTFGSGYYIVEHVREGPGWRIRGLRLEHRLADNALDRIIQQRDAGTSSTT